MSDELELAAQRLRDLSEWIDMHNRAKGANEQAMTWGRIAKVGEEFGEAIAEYVAFTGQNPRKPLTGEESEARVQKELLDVAVAALGAVEHLTGNSTFTIGLLLNHIRLVHKRAGLAGL